jgi:hypothetical protein
VEHRHLTYPYMYIRLHVHYTIHTPYLIITAFPSSLQQLRQSLILFSRRIQYRLHLGEFIFTFASNCIYILSGIFTFISFTWFKYHLSFILNFPNAARSRSLFLSLHTSMYKCTHPLFSLLYRQTTFLNSVLLTWKYSVFRAA